MCECFCGNVVVCAKDAIVGGNTRSCGCIRRGRLKGVAENPENRHIISRQDARDHGYIRYFTGVACGRGHFAERTTKGGTCILCTNITRARGEAKSRESGRFKEIRQKIERKRAVLWGDVIRAKARDRYAANPEKFRTKGKNYRTIHIDALREKGIVRSHQRRARQQMCAGSHTRDDVKQLLVSQKLKCAHAWCKVSIKHKRHIDHIIPLARGGTNGKNNIQLLCVRCNLSKGAKHPIDFAMMNGMLI